MKAIVLDRFGGPDVLRYAEVPEPTPGPDDVLVEVHAVSVNRTLDLAVRSGSYVRKPPLPHVLGVDPAGIVVAVGDHVGDRKVGDRVFVNLFVPTEDPRSVYMREVGRVQLLGVDRWGGYAEKVAVPAANTRIIPAGLDFAEAIALARHGPTALNLLERRAGMRSGDTVLVMGATGGLGSIAVQIAKLAGATVIAAAGAPERVAAASALGADHAIDYRAADLQAEVQRITDDRGVDIVCDNVGDPELWPKAFASLALGGRLVTAGAHAGSSVALDLRRLYMRRLQIIGDGSEAPGGIERIFDLAVSGAIRGLVQQVLPLSDAARAHELVASRTGVGKIVLAPQGVAEA